MRIMLFCGFLRGLKLLQRLIDRREDIVAVFVFPEDLHEEPKWSAQILQCCVQNQIPAELVRSMPPSRVADLQRQFDPEVVFCLGWRTMLAPPILNLTPRGVVAAHDSLLPRLRGFAPLNWGLLLGHERLGVTLFRLTAGVDDGDVYFQESFSADDSKTLGGLQLEVAEASVRLFEKYVDAAQAGAVPAYPQQHALATYTCSRSPEDGEIDWHGSTAAIVRLVRALAPPGPGAFSFYKGTQVAILGAHAVPNPPTYEGRIPGRIIARDTGTGTADVLSSDGIVRIETVSLAGQAASPAAQVFRSVRTSLGLIPSRELCQLRTLVSQLEQRIQALETVPRSAPQ